MVLCDSGDYFATNLRFFISAESLTAKRRSEQNSAPAIPDHCRGPMLVGRCKGHEVCVKVRVLDGRLKMSAADVTRLLLAWSKGDERALEQLTPVIYQELHRLARSYMVREDPGHTLQATALINEAYIRLIQGNRVQWRDRAHFYAISAKLMRRILVDFGRARRSQKRGKGRPVHLEESAAVTRERSADLVGLDEALEKLAAIDPRKSQIVELRFFGGLTVDETAEVLNIAPSTVYKEFDLAKLWLLREFERPNNPQ